MSGTAGAATQAAVLSLDMEGPWHVTAAQKSKALVQTYLLSRSVVLPTTAGGTRGTKSALRLPSIVPTLRGPRGWSKAAPLSLAQPSLLTPGERAICDGFSLNRCPSASPNKAPPPTPIVRTSAQVPRKSCHPPRSSRPHLNQCRVQISSPPAYIHISQPLQLSANPAAARRHSHNSDVGAETTQGDLRPFLTHRRHSAFQGAPLSIVGKPCLPRCSPGPAPNRAQLHVFLPTDREGEEGDSESVDEGFMDELDSKTVLQKFQHRAPKTSKGKRQVVGPASIDLSPKCDHI